MTEPQHTVPKTMRAMRVLEKDGPYVLQEVDVPQVGDLQILLRIKAAGHCHTDMMVQEGAYGKFPITGSHEPVGVVVAIGTGVDQFKVGDRVGATNIFGPCLECYDCKRKNYRYCESSTQVGLNIDGAFADYCLVDSRSSVLIPDNMPWDQASPMMCAGTTAFGAIKTAGLKPGSTLGVIGLGALGHIAVQMGKALGLIVVGVDARSEPIKMVEALRLKPDLVLNATETSAQAAVDKIAALDPSKLPRGLDACVVLTDAPAAFRYTLDLMAKHGTFVLVGLPEALTINYKDLIHRDLRVIGSLIGEAADAQATVDLVSKHNIEVKTTLYKFDQFEQILKDAHSSTRVGKAVVMM